MGAFSVFMAQVKTPSEIISYFQSLQPSQVLRMVRPAIERNLAVPDFKLDLDVYSRYDAFNPGLVQGCMATCMIAEVAGITAYDLHVHHENLQYNLRVNGINVLYRDLNLVRMGIFENLNFTGTDFLILQQWNRRCYLEYASQLTTYLNGLDEIITEMQEIGI